MPISDNFMCPCFILIVSMFLHISWIPQSIVRNILLLHAGEFVAHLVSGYKE